MEASEKQTFLIDGFPRNKDNLDGWNAAMSEVAEVKMVLFFSCSEQVSLGQRWKKILTLYDQLFLVLTLLCTEQPKLCGGLAVLSAIGLRVRGSVGCQFTISSLLMDIHETIFRYHRIMDIKYLHRLYLWISKYLFMVIQNSIYGYP